MLITVPAAIIKSSEVVFTSINEKAVIMCEAIGNPINDQMIAWKRNDSDAEIIPSERILISNEKGKSTLTLLETHASDIGHYKCVAFNGIGVQTETFVNLALKQKPVIIDTNWFAAASEAEEAVIKCKAIGVPNANFKWSNDVEGDLILAFSLEDIQSNQESKRYSISNKNLANFEFESKLTIKKVSATDIGSKFKCSAYNALGQDSIEIMLRQKGKPEAPVNVTIASINHDSVILSLIPGFDGGAQQTFRAKYKKVSTNSEQDHYQISEESNSTRIAIRGLEQATEYVVAVIAKNCFGESNFASKSLRFTTKFVEGTSGGSPLVDTLEKQKIKSFSKIVLMIIVIALGLLIVSANCAFILVYIKRKKKNDLQKNNQCCENSNGVIVHNQYHKECDQLQQQKQQKNHKLENHSKSAENLQFTHAEVGFSEINPQQFEFIASTLMLENSSDDNSGSKRCKVLSIRENIDKECSCFLKAVGDTPF
ncbi:Nephrin-like protein [Dinothrombium tinctorium]|uniref:Nephrin-like protein n=1 Tax=Dinothrombium tinctorium TaxID=1965070 RepID=A0A443QQG4_9ACAR|nr:Nephrin-like protein [Dinothrombium tinctorium]